MTWFKVDDRFAFHPKAMAAGNSALGLWVRAGSWSSANLTEGWLPASMLGTLGAQRRDATRLVAADLWLHTGSTPAAHRTHTSGTQEAHGPAVVTDGNQCALCGMPDGYLFRDWSHYQPTKEQVNAEREATRERQRKYRERVRNGVTNGVTNARSNGVSNDTPTRPDPTSLKNSSSEIADAIGRDDIEEICKHLADRIEANGSKRPTITKAWRTAARLMLDKDNRTVAQIIRAIDWCQADEFWRGNVLSLPKLREKYDQLRLQAQRQTPDQAKTAERERPRYVVPQTPAEIANDPDAEARFRSDHRRAWEARQAGAA